MQAPSHYQAFAVLPLLTALCNCSSSAQAEEPTTARMGIVWKDATGARVPIWTPYLAIANDPGDDGSSVARYFDPDGYIWGVNMETAEVVPAEQAPPTSLLFNDALCSSPAYVATGSLAPRITFVFDRLSGGSGAATDSYRVLRVLPDAAQVQSIPTGLFFRTSADATSECRRFENADRKGVPASATVPSTPLKAPAFNFKLPLHPEFG